MRLLNKNAAEGFLHLRLDGLDDLWAIRTLVAPGDHVTAETVRTMEAVGDRVRDTKQEKRTMRLTVKAEQVEWHGFDDHVRVLGPIVAGPQDIGKYHTLALRGDGMEVQIHKHAPLANWTAKVVDDAVASTSRPQVLLVAIDDEEAQFGTLRSYGLHLLGSLRSGGQGKRFAGAAEAKKRFYDEATRSLKMFRVPSDLPTVVVGPGWWREEFLEQVKAKDPTTAAGVTTDGTSQGGRAGLQEALKRGLVERVALGHRVNTETALVEELLHRVAAAAPVALGEKEVAHAVEAGAAEHVLATDIVVREGRLDALLRAAEAARARLTILSTRHDAGERLQHLGGVAALLRFAV